jgi:hypothetical protein
MEYILYVLKLIRDNQVAFIGFLGILVSWYFSRLNKKRESDMVMKDLFEGFNNRYDSLNNKLYDIVTDSKDNIKVTNSSELNKDQKKTIIDYFNLCAEEYFWYKRGRIDDKIWKSWKAGMNFWYSHNIISELWHEEVKSKNGKLSYYINNGDEFFADYQ